MYAEQIINLSGNLSNLIIGFACWNMKTVEHVLLKMHFDKAYLAISVSMCWVETIECRDAEYDK